MKGILFIPLGGLGERFSKMGYVEPKPLIKVMGTNIIFWVLDSLDLTNIEYVYIVYNNQLSKYRFEDEIRKYKDNVTFKFECLNYNTKGAAETLQYGLNKIINEDDKPIICIDGDNFYKENILKKWKFDNAIFTFEDECTDPIYSYVLEHNSVITDIQEKNKISNNACCGVYAFASKNKLLKYCNYVINNNIKDKNEYYISTVIKQMIKNGDIFKNISIDKENYVCLGTPLHVKLFCKNNDMTQIYKNKNEKRFCFDLDNTLVTYPKISGDYTTVEPIQSNIDLLNYLKQCGNTIIIHTARKMKSCGGNVGKINKEISQITFDTLEKFGIQFDELYFGKPYADFYIDDLGVSCFDDLEKKIGFYKTNIEPRDFNSIRTGNVQTYIKKSSDLSGEIYYYNNIDKSLRHLFPLVFRSDPGNKWYEMEKIDGISINSLFLSEEMTSDILQEILDNINKLHSFPITEQIYVNIYDNYCNKLKNRYESYNYGIFDNSAVAYNDIFDKLKTYEQQNEGKISVIHGDPVFTNIMIGALKNIKFIDVRGKIGKVLTVYGDRNYDYAKILQSLIGYDEILQEKYVDIRYKENLIALYKKYIVDKYDENTYENIKLITKSLLYSLIPLHNNGKCVSYYDLIFSSYLC